MEGVQTLFLSAVNKTEAECLIRLFNGLLGDQSDRRVGNGLDRGKFRNILHNTFGMTDDMIMDRGRLVSFVTFLHVT
jgi:hypothetical protein